MSKQSSSNKKGKKIFQALVLVVVLSVGYFVFASLMYWGKGWGSGRKVTPPKDPKWEKFRREADSPFRSREYLDALDESGREIARKGAESKDDPLASNQPGYYAEKPSPANPLQVMPNNEPVFGKSDNDKYPDTASIFGLGLPDSTPLTEKELNEAIREIGEKAENLTLPAEAEPGPEKPPRSENAELDGLYLQLRKLKNGGEISELAIRAIRNGHVVVHYAPFAYGEPTVVQSIEPALTASETTDQTK